MNNTKLFEYRHKDIPALKKDIAMRVFFVFLFLATFTWQTFNIFSIYMQGTITPLMITVGSIVMLLSLILAATSALYTYKDYKIISSIKKKGKSLTSVNILFKTRKRSFIKLFSFINTVLSLAILVVFVCSATYSVLQAIYYGIFSYYLPALLFIVIASFSSTYQIKTEIDTVSSVEEFHSLL